MCGGVKWPDASITFGQLAHVRAPPRPAAAADLESRHCADPAGPANGASGPAIRPLPARSLGAATTSHTTSVCRAPRLHPRLQLAAMTAALHSPRRRLSEHAMAPLLGGTADRPAAAGGGDLVKPFDDADTVIEPGKGALCSLWQGSCTQWAWHLGAWVQGAPGRCCCKSIPRSIAPLPTCPCSRLGGGVPPSDMRHVWRRRAGERGKAMQRARPCAAPTPPCPTAPALPRCCPPACPHFAGPALCAGQPGLGAGPGHAGAGHWDIHLRSLLACRGALESGGWVGVGGAANRASLDLPPSCCPTGPALRSMKRSSAWCSAALQPPQLPLQPRPLPRLRPALCRSYTRCGMAAACARCVHWVARFGARAGAVG